jgi:CRISPR-associated protein Cas1
MIKRTLYFENPAYLSMKDKQMVVKLPGVEKSDTLPDFKGEREDDPGRGYRDRDSR